MTQCQSKVSIFIPTFNRSGFLKELLKPLLAKKYSSNISINICDNASTDRGYRDIPKLIENSSIFNYVKFQDWLPALDNFNRCLELGSCSDYVAIYHDDNIYFPDIIDKTVQFLDSNGNIGLVGTSGWIIDLNGKIIGERVLNHTGEIISGCEFINSHLTYGNMEINCPSIMYRVKALPKKPFNTEGPVHGNDYPLWLKIGENWDIGFLHEKLFKYRDHCSQLSKGSKKQIEKIYIGYANNLFIYTKEYLKKYPNEFKQVSRWNKAILRRTVIKIIGIALWKLDKKEDISEVFQSLRDLNYDMGIGLQIIINLATRINNPRQARLIRNSVKFSKSIFSI